MPLNDVVEVRILSTVNSQLGEMVLHYKITDIEAPEATVSTIAQKMNDSFITAVKALLSQQATYGGVTAQRVFPIRSVRGEFFDESGAGTGSTSLLPTQTAGLVTKSTALAGRRNRGRAYVPFPGESDSTDTTATPVAGYITRLQTLCDVMVNGLVAENPVGGGSSTLTPVIFHRSLGTTISVTNVAPRRNWATQRRRGAYGQPNIFG